MISMFTTDFHSFNSKFSVVSTAWSLVKCGQKDVGKKLATASAWIQWKLVEQKEAN